MYGRFFCVFVCAYFFPNPKLFDHTYILLQDNLFHVFFIALNSLHYFFSIFKSLSDKNKENTERTEKVCGYNWIYILVIKMLQTLHLTGKCCYAHNTYFNVNVDS